MLQNAKSTCPSGHNSMNSAACQQVNNIDNPKIRASIEKLIKRLEENGKICPKPWYWERFFILFKPRYKPCWLSSWWRTPNEGKKELFRKQLFFLAYRTDHYLEACKFLYELEDMNWLYD